MVYDINNMKDKKMYTTIGAKVAFRFTHTSALFLRIILKEKQLHSISTNWR